MNYDRDDYYLDYEQMEEDYWLEKIKEVNEHYRTLESDNT
jgi:hypothetical protein